MNLFRIFYGAILLFSILFMPLWVSVILAFGGMIYFPVYAEAVILFLLSDLLFGARIAKYGEMIFVSFLIFLAALLILEGFKKKLKFYN